MTYTPLSKTKCRHTGQWLILPNYKRTGSKPFVLSSPSFLSKHKYNTMCTALRDGMIMFKLMATILLDLKKQCVTSTTFKGKT